MKSHSLKFVAVIFLFQMAAVSVQAANVAAEMKAPNTQVCIMSGARLDKNAPADKSKLKKYCECVSDEYWNSVPQKDFDGMNNEMQKGNFDGPYSQSLNAHSGERLQAAGRKCSGS